MYRIPLLGKTFDRKEDADEYFSCVGCVYTDILMDGMSKQIRSIPEKDRAGYELAYQLIMDALGYLDSEVQASVSKAECLIDRYIEEV